MRYVAARCAWQAEDSERAHIVHVESARLLFDQSRGRAEPAADGPSARSAGTRGRYTARPPPGLPSRGNSERQAAAWRRAEYVYHVAPPETHESPVGAGVVGACVCVCVCRGGPLPPLVRYSAAWSGARANQRASRHGPRAQVLSLDWYSRKMCVRACGAVREKWAEAADPVRARGISVYFGWRCVKEKVLLTVAWWTRFTHVYAQYMYVSSMSHAFYMNSTASSTEQRAGAGFGCSTSTLSPPWRITL